MLCVLHSSGLEGIKGERGDTEVKGETKGEKGDVKGM